MFESTLSAQELSQSDRRLGPLSAAIFGHLALVSAIVAVTAMIVPPVKPPELPIFVSVSRPPELGSPSSGAAQPKKGAGAPKPNRWVAPQPPIQPQRPPAATPETLPTTDGPPEPEGAGVPGDEGSGVPDGTGGASVDGPGVGDGGPGGPGVDPVVLSGNMVKPELVLKVEPMYPDVARIARLGGRVTVKAVIGLDGSVESAEIFASTSPLFNEAAIGAVRKWRYRPALLNGSPVRIYFTVVVDFSVR